MVEPQEIISFDDRVNGMRSQGMTTREIAACLDVSKSKVGRVPILSHSVPDSVPFVPQSEATGWESTLGELKVKFNSILKRVNERLISLEKGQEDMQKEFNERVNRFLTNALDNRLEGIKTEIIKQCVQELNKG